MKVETNRPVRSVSLRRAGSSGKAKDVGFASHLEAQAERAGSVRAGGAVELVVLLQEISDATDDQAQAQARARGEEVLDQLEQIRHGLLLGKIPRHNLEALEHAVAHVRGAVADPRLREILGEIELRARVELAKLARAA